MADQTHNQSIEAADLLFGPSDSPGQDFFGSVLGDSEQAPAASQPAPAKDHTPPDTSREADALFSSDTAAESLFDVPVNQDFAAHDVHSTDALQAADTAVDYADYSQQGWYDEHGQWHYYETQDANGGTSSHAHCVECSTSLLRIGAYYETDPYATQDTSATHAHDASEVAAHDPYAPSYIAPATQSGASQYYGYEQTTASRPTYDTSTSQYYAQSAYTPAQPTSSTYAPQGTSSLASSHYAPTTASAYQPPSSYDSYTPTVQPTYTPQTTSSYPVSAYAPPAPSHASYDPPAAQAAQTSLSRDDTIKPRKAAVNQYRSGSYNAYDPPIPAVTTRSRIASATSPPVPSAYDPYNRTASPAQLPAPPPPRAAAVPPPPPRSGSAMSARATTSYGPPPAANPETNGAAFFASLQPPQQAYSLNSPGYPVQQLQPEVAARDELDQDSTTAVTSALNYEQPAVNGLQDVAYHAPAPYSVQRTDGYDPEGQHDPESHGFDGGASYQATPVQAYSAHNGNAPPRTASRAASLASPPPRPSSVAQPPSRTGSAASQTRRTPSVTTSPPPRASYVASPPPRASSVASPPPRAPSVASVTSQPGNGASRYVPLSSATVSPPQSVAGSTKDSPQDPYAPKNMARRDTYEYAPPLPPSYPPQQADLYRPRTASIASVSSSSATSPPPSAWGSPSLAVNAYAPLNGTSSYVPTSAPSAPYAPVASPYAPPVRTRGASEVSDYGGYATSRFEYGGQPADNAKSVTSESGDATHHAPAYTYAPSPSLSGTNDPLGRASAKVPVFSFGFGGKFVTCFHTPAGLTDGFDVSFSARPSTAVGIKRLHEIIPASAWETSSASFPGPLLSDPGTPTTSLVPPVRSNTNKGKKAAVLKYLEERADEMERGLSYVSDNTVERHRAEAKLVLLRLLKVVTENDGQFSGRYGSRDDRVQCLMCAQRQDRGSCSLSPPGFTPRCYRFVERRRTPAGRLLRLCVRWGPHIGGPSCSV